MNEAIRALVGIHFSRVRRLLFSIVVLVASATGLGVAREGWSIDSTLPWILGACMVLPVTPGFSMVREKIDGSLRYFASLPVSGKEHAMARAIVSVLLCLPIAVLGTVYLYAKVPSVGAAATGLTFVGSLLMTTAISLALVSMQYKVPTGRAANYALYAIIGILFGSRGLAFLVELDAMRRVRAALATPAGLSILSLLLWASMAAVAWFSFKSLAKSAVTYREEFTEP